MTRKLTYVAYFAFIAFALGACDKDNGNDKATNSLENTNWVATITDGNPSTNPPGEFGMNGTNNYYPWLECHMDDTFSFSKDRLTINDKGTACENGLDLIFETKNQTYAYNAATKKLTVGSGDDQAILDVYELNKDRLKLGIPIVTNGGGGNIILLLKRK